MLRTLYRLALAALLAPCVAASLVAQTTVDTLAPPIVPAAALRDTTAILRWTDLTAPRLARLDRARTVILLPAGIVETHGALLANGTELARNERLARDLADAIVARPGWTVVIAPTVPLGSGAFDRRAGRLGFAGSLAVRASTVQAVFTDLADDIGAQGFRHAFIVNGHADANHDRALDLAGDYFVSTYGGVMVHLRGRRGCHVDGVQAPPLELFNATAMTADGDSPHGGALETSVAWYLQPERVDSIALRTTTDMPAKGSAEWARVARRPDWRGYVGAPRFASLELGAWLYEAERRGCTELALRLLDGLDERTVVRVGEQLRAYPDVRAMLDAQSAVENETAARQQRALTRRPARP
jgi:creatinine amidohydrolase/Fe(II)-dependent formamide hydrolase-like protein